MNPFPPGISTELCSRGPSPAPLLMKGKPATGIHSGPIISARPDQPHPCTDIIGCVIVAGREQRGAGNGPYACGSLSALSVELR